MNILFVAGSDLNFYHGHRAHHLIKYLESGPNRLDIVSLKSFYADQRPATSWVRLRQGLGGMRRGCVRSVERSAGVQIEITKLPSRLNPAVQDFWAYFHLRKLLNKQYDMCIFGNPDNVMLPLLLKRSGKIRTIVYDDWDYYPGFPRSKFWRLLMKFRERLCFSIADTAISVGPLLADLRKSQGTARIYVIPNGVEYDRFARAQKKKPHPPTLVYLGSLLREYGVDVSIIGFAEIRKQIPEARYLIIGLSEGPHAQYLKALVQTLDLKDSVVFLGRREYDDLPALLAEADVGVALFRPMEVMKYAFPLKVIEYMAAGLAVVGSKIGETENLIRESGCGEAVEFAASDFSRAVLKMMSDKNALADNAQNGAQFARAYDWSHLFQRMFRILETVGT